MPQMKLYYQRNYANREGVINSGNPNNGELNIYLVLYVDRSFDARKKTDEPKTQARISLRGNLALHISRFLWKGNKSSELEDEVRRILGDISEKVSFNDYTRGMVKGGYEPRDRVIKNMKHYHFYRGRMSEDKLRESLTALENKCVQIEEVSDLTSLHIKLPFNISPK